MKSMPGQLRGRCSIRFLPTPITICGWPTSGAAPRPGRCKNRRDNVVHAADAEFGHSPNEHRRQRTSSISPNFFPQGATSIPRPKRSRSGLCPASEPPLSDGFGEDRRDFGPRGMETDRVVRLTRDGKTVEYLMPSETNMRSAFGIIIRSARSSG